MYSFEEKFTLMTYFIHNYISFAVNQIALYHRTRTSIGFWYKQSLNPGPLFVGKWIPFNPFVLK